LNEDPSSIEYTPVPAIFIKAVTAVPDNNEIYSFIFRDVMSAIAPPFPFWEAVSKLANRPVPGFVSAL